MSTLDLVVLGLSARSSWGNGHATTYRALLRAMAARGHEITFLERDEPRHADHVDDPEPEGLHLRLYGSLEQLEEEHGARIRRADVVIVGSSVPEGVAVGRYVTREARGVTAFYDLDTPVTLAKLARGDDEYLEPALVCAYDLYLSSTGGPTLDHLRIGWGARRPEVLYGSVDAERYRPTGESPAFDLGYLGAWSEDRQPKVEAFLLEVARRSPERRFVVGGPGYPDPTSWPANVEHRAHVAPGDHPSFYSRQRLTLNVTRPSMVRAGFSPSVRLFEAAACGVPIVSDVWDGLEDVLQPGREVLLARSTGDVLDALALSEERLAAVGLAGRLRVLERHTAEHRASELEGYLRSAMDRGARRWWPVAEARP